MEVSKHTRFECLFAFQYPSDENYIENRKYKVIQSLLKREGKNIPNQFHQSLS